MPKGEQVPNGTEREDTLPCGCLFDVRNFRIFVYLGAFANSRISKDAAVEMWMKIHKFLNEVRFFRSSEVGFNRTTFPIASAQKRVDALRPCHYRFVVLKVEAVFQILEVIG